MATIFPLSTSCLIRPSQASHQTTKVKGLPYLRVRDVSEKLGGQGTEAEIINLFVLRCKKV